MTDLPDVRKVFFTNLLVLGFKPIALERKWRIPFNKDMFALPNKKGFEVVMYFLFNRLNPIMCHERFKDCAVIADKKDEQHFRKVCYDWLQEIASVGKVLTAQISLPNHHHHLSTEPGPSPSFPNHNQHGPPPSHLVEPGPSSSFPNYHPYPHPAAGRYLSAGGRGAGWEDADEQSTASPAVTCLLETDANVPMPRVVASLFMSPGGDKIYQLLVYFSTYVLNHVIHKENGVTKDEMLRRPTLSRQNQQMGQAMQATVKAATVSRRQHFLQQSQQVVCIQEQWQAYGSELVRNYRTLDSDIRDLEQQLKEERNKVAEKSASRRSVSTGHGRSQYDLDVQRVHRTERVRKVREQWKHVENILASQRKEQEVVKSILEGTQEGHCVDAKDLNIHLPDLLLRECEQEIQRRNVDNIYQGGKLNLVSLIHLFNLSLHLYIEKFHQTNLPKFDSLTPKVTAQAHTQQAHLTNTQQLRSLVKSRLIPELKKHIHSLREQLNTQVFQAKSPESIRMTSIGLGFLPPTPPVNFSAEGADPSSVPGNEPFHLTSEHIVSTPEAANLLMKNIEEKVKDQPVSSLVQGSPVFAARLATQGKPTGANVIPSSRLPVRGKPNAQAARIRHHLVGADSAEESVYATESGTTLHCISPQVGDSARRAIQDQSINKSQRGASVVKRGKRTTNVTPSVERHLERKAKSPDGFDVLADQVADAVMLGASPLNLRQVIGGIDLEEELDAEAFVSKDKLQRTPPKMKSALSDDNGSDEDDSRIVTLTHGPEPRWSPSSHKRRHPSGCEDTTRSQLPSRPVGHSEQLSQPPDRIHDMRATLPQGRGLALTPETMVIAGDLLGMTEEDHLARRVAESTIAPPGAASDSEASSAVLTSGPELVQGLPISTDSDYGQSGSRSPEVNSEEMNYLQSVKQRLARLAHMRDAVQEDLPDKPKEDISVSRRSVKSEHPSGYSTSTQIVAHDLATNDQGEPLYGAPSQVDDYQELVNASASVVEVESRSVFEKADDHERTRPSFLKDRNSPLLEEGGFSRNMGTRCSFRDVEESVLQSFVSSSLHPLTQTLSHKSGGSSRSPVRSRSPRQQEANPINAPSQLSVADIIARYKLLKESQAKNCALSSADGGTGGSSQARGLIPDQSSSPSGSRPHTPETRSSQPVLSERYLQKTPTKAEDGALSKRFSLDLDEPTNVTATSPVAAINELSPVSATHRPPFELQARARETPLMQTTPTHRPNLPSQGSSLPSHTPLAVSPVTKTLHSFNLEQTVPARLNIENILDEQVPPLFPTSPLLDEPHRTSPQTPPIGNLIDI